VVVVKWQPMGVATLFGGLDPALLGTLEAARDATLDDSDILYLYLCEDNKISSGTQRRRCIQCAGAVVSQNIKPAKSNLAYCHTIYNFS
jgi:hypothetical protein